MVAPNNEYVEYDIRLQAREAITQLQTLTQTATTFGERVAMVQAQLQAFSQTTGMSFKAAKSFFQDMDKTLADTGQQSAIFGNMAKQGWMDVGNGAQDAGRKVEQAGKGITSVLSVVRIALGILVSMLVRNVLQAFQTMAQGAIKGLVEVEAAMYNIVNAEKKLSEQGVDIKVEDLQALIKTLQELDPMLSKFQATELISVLSTKVAPAIGLGKEQIESLAKSITLLAVRNQALGKSFEEVEQQVVTGLLSGRVTAGINQLGVKITDQIVQEEALRLRLVETSDAYDALNAKEQERINALAIISILEQNTAEEAESLPTFLQTASGLISVAKAEFQDLLTSLGQKFAPLLKEVLRGVIAFLERINQSLVENEDAWNAMVTLLTIGARAVANLAIGFLNLSLRIGETGKKIYEFLGALPILGDIVKKLFPDQIFPDTPTGTSSKSTSSSEETEKEKEKEAKKIQDAEDKITDIMRDARDKRLDLERDYQDKMADIATDYSRKLADIAQDTADKREDALRDYNQKVEDINRDTSQKIQEAQQDDRQKEIDREAQFQQKLKELREKYLFDLEDALHERDARQILRLMRQYSRDKANLEDRHKLEQAEAAQTLQIRVKQLEDERKLKLEAAQREYNDKIAEIAIGEKRALAEAAIWHQRALEDARTWYNRQLRDQQTYLQRKLRDVAEALGREIQMNGSAASAIASIWSNAFASILTGFNASISGLLTPNIGTGGAVIGGSYVDAAAGWAAQAQTFTNAGMYGTGYEEGGTLLATHPQTVTFGEVPEVVSFQPLKGGNNTDRVFGDKSALGGSSMEIVLTLSPDLEARVVNKSMDAAADIVLKVNRSKV